MCTAVSYKTKDHYFGRNLDFEFSYNETVTITPRNYPFVFQSGCEFEGVHDDKNYIHYAMIGMAYVVGDYPLYYDAVNEKGLGMAGLLFAGNAVYCSDKDAEKLKEGSYKEKNSEDLIQLASYEFIPWILGQCSTVEEAKKQLKRIQLMDWAFSEELPPSPLHWLIADRDIAITVEAVADGIKVYVNPVKVLTNNPPFDFQMMNLNHYLHLSIDVPENRFSDQVDLTPYSRGMGALGMPGDLSSVSRFIRAAFTRMNSVSGDSEEESISQFFHILGFVEQQRGCVRMPKKESVETTQKDEYEITIYSCCCNTDKGIYYYTTYENQQITAVDMYKENLESDKLVAYPLIMKQQIRWQN